MKYFVSLIASLLTATAHADHFIPLSRLNSDPKQGDVVMFYSWCNPSDVPSSNSGARIEFKGPGGSGFATGPTFKWRVTLEDEVYDLVVMGEKSTEEIRTGEYRVPRQPNLNDGCVRKKFFRLVPVE